MPNQQQIMELLQMLGQRGGQGPQLAGNVGPGAVGPGAPPQGPAGIPGAGPIGPQPMPAVGPVGPGMMPQGPVPIPQPQGPQMSMMDKIRLMMMMRQRQGQGGGGGQPGGQNLVPSDRARDLNRGMMEYIQRAMMESQAPQQQFGGAAMPQAGAGQSTMDTLRGRGMNIDEMVRRGGG